MKQILYRLFEHQFLGRDEARNILQNIVAGKYSEAQIASLITVFLMRSISVEELAGFRDALLEMRVAVRLDDFDPIDIVGTGGDGKNTFNVSTASCFVVAGAGYPVAKHGNYGATSVSGASNVMEYFGVKFTTNEEKLRRSIGESNMAYLHAPLFNPALKAVAGVRKSLGVRSFFNMLGPLVNPSIPRNQLLGVYNLPLLRLYSYAFQQSGNHFAIVHSLDGYDEISLTDAFKVVTGQSEHIYTPEELGLPRTAASDLFGGETPDEAARIFLQVLQGTSTAARKACVAANAAFAIRVLSPAKTITECLALAHESLESGKAYAHFTKFVELNH
ncbi:MAG: anthranilate phosphoribosyltransferase [Marinilabiliales bacterium]|nr:anthranilate phosphoribosyltransferase [Marinilabiliales bacterium]